MQISCFHCGKIVGSHYCDFYFGKFLNVKKDTNHFVKVSNKPSVTTNELRPTNAHKELK